MTYFIVENQIRADGIVNHSTTARQSFASAISYYHERYSKMAMTELYPSVALMLIDERCAVLEKAIVPTLYPQPVEDAPSEE